MTTKLNKKGFTIIEVLIVLAIAGLILLIVFLAVPALQRNSRNTQRRNEVAILLSAVNEYATNNKGSLPGVWDSTDKEFQKDSTSADGSGVEPALSFYGVTDVTYATTVPATLPTADVGKVYIYGTAKCSTNTATSTGASARNVAAYYFIEPGAGTTGTAQCTEG